MIINTKQAMGIDHLDGDETQNNHPLLVYISGVAFLLAIAFWIQVILNVSIIRYPPISTVINLPQGLMLIAFCLSVFSLISILLSWARAAPHFRIKLLLLILNLILLVLPFLMWYFAKTQAGFS
jgi:hypothetical protein